MYRPDWYEAASRGLSVTEIATNLSSICRGSSEETEGEFNDYVLCLKQVLQDWKPSFPNNPGMLFDLSVQELVQEALCMAESFRSEDEDEDDEPNLVIKIEPGHCSSTRLSVAEDILQAMKKHGFGKIWITGEEDPGQVRKGVLRDESEEIKIV